MCCNRAFIQNVQAITANTNYQDDIPLGDLEKGVTAIGDGGGSGGGGGGGAATVDNMTASGSGSVSTVLAYNRMKYW